MARRAVVELSTSDEVAESLERIDREVIKLFALVGEGVAGATHSLLAGDREAARVLAESDETIDALYLEVEQLAQSQLAQRATGPVELRYLVAVLRMLPELERSGDLAEHVSRRAVRGLGMELSPRARGLVEQMGEVACDMWRATADAYADRAPVAEQVEELDDELDELHVTLTAEIASGSMALPVAIEAALVARFYERIGDHAADVQAQDRLEFAFPFPDVRLAGGDHRLLGVDLHRQDLEALRVSIGHDVRDRGEVDFQRVDVEIAQADLGRQPLGEQFEVQQFVGRQERLPFLIGDHREGVMIGALHAPVRYQLVGLGTADDPVPDQVVQHLGKSQFSVDGDFGGGLHGVHYSGNARAVQITLAPVVGIRAAGCVNISSPCRGLSRGNYRRLPAASRILRRQGKAPRRSHH